MMTNIGGRNKLPDNKKPSIVVCDWKNWYTISNKNCGT